MDFWQDAIIAVMAAVVGSFVTSICGYFNNRKKERKDKSEELYKTRPEFQIIQMEDYFSDIGMCISTQPCDLEVFIAPVSSFDVEKDTNRIIANYDSCLLDKKNWVCRQYVLKNIGQTAVYEVSIASFYQYSICVFDLNDDLMQQWITDGLLHYRVMFDKRIGAGETFTLKLCYHQDKIVQGLFSANMCLILNDDNKNYWRQAFFAPENKIYESRMISYKDYIEQISTDAVEKHFTKGMLL